MQIEVKNERLMEKNDTRFGVQGLALYHNHSIH